MGRNIIYSWSKSILVIVITDILISWTLVLGVNTAELLSPSRIWNETWVKSILEETVGETLVEDGGAISTFRITNSTYRSHTLRRNRLRRRISSTETSQSSSSDSWVELNLIVQYTNLFQIPSTGVNPADTVVTNNFILNGRNQVVGNVQQSCIRSTNFVCTWTIFSASISSTGCDIYLQGIFIPTSTQVFNTPLVQNAAITGGTGPCRGIRGEAVMSLRQLPAGSILQWDYTLIYRIPSS
jgi:hypothetical protein